MKNKGRIQISSGTAWEKQVGYSRAVRIGNIVEVAGTTAIDGALVVAKGDIYGQTIFILRKIEKVLHEAGCSLNDVVRTRMFITDISNWKEAGRAHGEFFKEILPVTTMVEVSALIDPELLIEIEVTAVLQS